MPSEQQHAYRQLLRDELELLRRLSIARRSASTRLPILRRTGLARLPTAQRDDAISYGAAMPVRRRPAGIPMRP